MTDPTEPLPLAAQLLAARASGRLVEQAGEYEPRDAEEAYAVQARVAAGIGRVTGWKVGARDPEAEPFFAPLLEPLFMPAGSTLPHDAFRLWRIESELAFRFGRDVPATEAPLDRTALLGAIDEVCAVFEIVDSRFAAWPELSPLLMLADGLSHGAMVVGSGVEPDAGLDYGRVPVRLAIDGRIVAEAVGGNAAGDPVRLLLWLAGRLAADGRGLRAGDLVTTGSCTGLVELAPGAAAEAVFDGIGTVRIGRGMPG